MEEKVYQDLCQKMAKRVGRYPGMDIPEFYNVIKALFTPEEAEVFNAIPKGYHPASTIAANLERNEQKISSVLERKEILAPPVDQQALSEAVKKAT